LPGELLTAPDVFADVEQKTETLLALRVSSLISQYLENVSPPENVPGAAALGRILASQETDLLVTRTDGELFYRITAPRTALGNEISSEDLAAIGREIIAIPQLETQDLDLPDGTSIQELKAPNVEVNIVDEHPYTFVTVSFEGKAVRLSLSPDLIMLTNASLLPSDESEAPVSTCLSSADAWIRPSDVYELFPALTRYRSDSLLLALINVSEVASNSRQTRVCW
jgi:hypothetical protein